MTLVERLGGCVLGVHDQRVAANRALGIEAALHGQAQQQGTDPLPLWTPSKIRP